MVGPILNPLTATPISGFQLRTLSSKLGNIAVGFGSLEVTESAIIDSSGDAGSLTVTE